MKISFVLVTYIFLLAGLVVGQRRANHGEPCNRLTRCDSRASLTCQKGICACILPETMTFDSRYGRCSVLPGEKCVYTTVETDSRVEGRSWKEEIPCIPSAQCQDGFCVCFTGFYETSSSSCEPKKDHREDCDTETACRDDKFLICDNDKRCDCNNTIATYDFQRQTCVSRPGVKCGDYHQCVVNAYCRNPHDYSRSATLGQGAFCECDDGFFANSHGACERKRGFGEECEADNHCQSEDYTRLICGTNGRCGCNTTTSFFDRGSNMCRRLAGVSCADFPFCIENSECGRLREYLDTEEPTCDCGTGYFVTKNGTCEQQRMFGQSCEADDNCKKGLTCNLENGLCQCDLTKYVYDRVKLKCVGLANSPCIETEDCITNSECHWGNDETRKQCLCRAGYAHSSNGSCLASHDVWCSDDWTFACNHEQGLVCKEGKCACKFSEFQEFETSGESKICVSQINGPCDDLIPCVPNAICSTVGEGTKEVIRRCQCNRGFVQVDGKCEFSIGQSCNYSTEIPKCDSLAPLYCIEGICQCTALQVYDHSVMKCRGLVGSTCFAQNETEKDSDNFCIQGAECVKRRFSFKGPGVCKCKRGWKETKDRKCLTVLTEGHIVHFRINSSAVLSSI